jgi:hypothetical protein
MKIAKIIDIMKSFTSYLLTGHGGARWGGGVLP